MAGSAAGGRRGPPFDLRSQPGRRPYRPQPCRSSSRGCASPGSPAHSLTIGPCRSGLAGGSSTGPLQGCGDPGRGPGSWALQARHGARRNPIRERGKTLSPEQQRRRGRPPDPDPAVRCGAMRCGAGPSSPSFQAALRAPALPPSWAARAHLLVLYALSLSLSLSLAFFLSFYLPGPGSPSLGPSSPLGRGAPPTSSRPPRASLLAQAPGPGSPGSAPSPQLPPGLRRRRCRRPREAARRAHLGTACGGPRKHAPTSRPVPSPNTPGSLGFPELGLTACPNR